jgi:electron transport complex protein RnfA
MQEAHGFIESIVFGIGTALGFTLVLVLFAALREQIDVADVPAPFQGASIGLITAGLMSMAFMGFIGLA